MHGAMGELQAPTSCGIRGRAAGIHGRAAPFVRGSRNLSQLHRGDVLVVGAGNSGAEIAMETVTRHRTWLTGRAAPGTFPCRWTHSGTCGLSRLVLRVIFHRVLWIGHAHWSQAAAEDARGAAPLIRTKPRHLAAAVCRESQTWWVQNGLPLLEDGRVLDVANIVWCTWIGVFVIDLPAFGADGMPSSPTPGWCDKKQDCSLSGLPFLLVLVGDDSWRGSRRRAHRRRHCEADCDTQPRHSLRWRDRADGESGRFDARAERISRRSGEQPSSVRFFVSCSAAIKVIVIYLAIFEPAGLHAIAVLAAPERLPDRPFRTCARASSNDAASTTENLTALLRLLPRAGPRPASLLGSERPVIGGSKVPCEQLHHLLRLRGNTRHESWQVAEALHTSAGLGD